MKSQNQISRQNFIQIKYTVGLKNEFCLFDDDSSGLRDEVQVLSHSGETSWVSNLAT